MSENQEDENVSAGTHEVGELESSSIPSREAADADLELTEEAVVAIAELLEVALHTILYIRQVYPVEFFERRKKLGVPVFQCVERSVMEYISEIVKAISEEIAEDAVAKVTITIHRSDTPLEKFIFSFETDESSGTEASNAEKTPLDLVQRQARGMLRKLNAIDAQLLPLDASDDLSFAVVMQLREEGAFRISEEDIDFETARADADGEKSREPSPSDSVVGDLALVHIIRTGQRSVYLHVQESEAKERRLASGTPKSGEET